LGSSWADVILLDEPTAHLDAESGRAMLAELRHGLRSRTVVLVTHNPDDIGAGDSRLDLDEAAASSRSRVNHLHAPALSLPGRLPIRPG
jgi:ABC-type transport system involved in cytochrome bd biosynthesis fused ATPase/permease subunit